MIKGPIEADIMRMRFKQVIWAVFSFILGFYKRQLIEYSGTKKRKPALFERATVVLGRIELPTHGFSVHCSTI